MKNKRKNPARYIALCVIPAVMAVAYVARLIYLQFAADENTVIFGANTTYTEPIVAQRGEIYDRNGKILVKNRYYYNLYLDYNTMPYDNAGFNSVILSVCGAAAAKGDADKLTDPGCPFVGNGVSYLFAPGYESGTAKKEKLVKLLVDMGYGNQKTSKEDRTAAAAAEPADKIVSWLMKRYELIDKEGNYLYTREETELLLARRFALNSNAFSPYNRYKFADGISVPMLAMLMENNVEGIATEEYAVREYCYPGYASHILGTVGRITAETQEYFVSRGYDLETIVGTSGAELVFEEYLHGTDGERTFVLNPDGEIVRQYVSKEPSSGSDVWLTIDIDLQIAAEDALAKTIEDIAYGARISGQWLKGEDADAGACVAVSPSTGQIYAMASNPSFDLSTYSQDYASLATDKRSPLMNRALNGLYTPGSTFKPITACASLSEGVISRYTTIYDSGVYTYYDDYQPHCWVYDMYGWGHGELNVIGGIKNSCNIFFFECGRRLGIEKLDRYAYAFGLGKPTGIEYSEETGSVSTPEYKKSIGDGGWLPADTIQTAIGQSYNQFTPLQFSVYLSTLLNCGTRYRITMLYQVRSYPDGKILYSASPEILEKTVISADAVAVVKEAMENTPDHGSTQVIFDGYPVRMGAKTGTAQVSSTSSDNGTFIAFAPVDEPEIVMSAVIEHGASGTPLGNVVKSVFDVYFGLLPKEEGE